MRTFLETVALAFRDAFAREQRQALLVSVGATFLIFVLLALSVHWGIAAWHLSERPWVGWLLQILGEFAVLGLTWLLFPAVSTTILSFFLDRVLARLDRRHYPDLPPALTVPLGAIIKSGLRLLGLTIALNLLAVPIYVLVPALNLVLFYLLNGYLLSREYFDLVALRRLDGMAANALWRGRRGRWMLGGITIAGLLSIPVLNLAAPLVAASLMLHLVTDTVTNRAAARTASALGQQAKS
ncbi:MAG TPA: EI24 domain-containing protein [Stellaceae bacterium]|nr:EI24 domain-containing protein [Stellaceae bacterium]